MNFIHEIITPKSELLKKYITSFNVLNELDLNREIIYSAFPQRGITVVFFKNAQIDVVENAVKIEFIESHKCSVVQLGKFLSPIKVHYKNYGPKISIHFSETGVNYFFPNYFKDFSAQNIRVYPLEKFDLDSKKMFNKDLDFSIAYLEKYLERKFQFVEIGEIERTVLRIIEDSSIPNVQLAHEAALSEKTLNRRFQRYLGCRIFEYKRIVKFKEIVKDHFNNHNSKLIHLCYNNGYYDESHLNKKIKLLTENTLNIMITQ